jgi:hypothetical protein
MDHSDKVLRSDKRRAKERCKTAARMSFAAVAFGNCVSVHKVRLRFSQQNPFRSLRFSVLLNALIGLGSGTSQQRDKPRVSVGEL